ncbi:MAG: hypothetical protein ABI741_09760 [Ferruginibacter sp.]
MEKKSIDKLVEETINSFDGAERASTKPFLLTRIYARMQNQPGTPNIWARAAAFLSMPRVALAGLLLILALNAAIIIKKTNADNITVQNTAVIKDEFAINVISIYDIENQEP